MLVAIGPSDQGRKDNQNPLPEHERTFQGSPQTGDPVVNGSGAGSIERHVSDGEIHCDKRVNQRQGGDSDENELPQYCRSGAGEKKLAPATSAEKRRGDPPEGKGQRDQNAGVT